MKTKTDPASLTELNDLLRRLRAIDPSTLSPEVKERAEAASLALWRAVELARLGDEAQ